MHYQRVRVPDEGEAIVVNADDTLNVPTHPLIPMIRGDGIGVDVTPVMQRVVEAAVAKAYGKQRKIVWLPVYAGEQAAELYDGEYLPDETLDALQRYVVSIKGPLTTPVGEGFRSLNVSIRQSLELYACVRPIHFFPGIQSPLRHAEATDMVVFRENTEDIYAGIEWPAGSEEALKLARFLEQELKVTSLRYPTSTGMGVKPVSKEGSMRLVRKALQYAVENDRTSVTLVHKGNIMKYTEGAFRNWGYEVARSEFGAKEISGGPWLTFDNPQTGSPIVVKDVIADNFLQQILLTPDEYDIIATLNLNGDYISDALAAQVGGIGIAPGANMSDSVAVFEATHGTAPGFAGRDIANPGSLILSAEMMLRYLGWLEAAELIRLGVARTLEARILTYDLARVHEALPESKRARAARRGVDQQLERLIPGAKVVGTKAFGEAVIEHMGM